VLAVSLIALATLAAFGNSFAGPFLFDDGGAISDNPTIRQLWPLWKPLCPPIGGQTVTGRPLLNLSLAINYAVGGFRVWGYHATNLAIHLVAALLLFGVLRRTLLLPALRNQWGAAATPFALATALLWAIHPLQTESVTYIVQRAESLVGLFYLLTLYCFIRGADTPRAIWWYAGAVLACLMGMASKEVMVSAPLMVLLYDRTFLAGSFRDAWRRRYGLYLALGSTWLLLGWLVASAGNRGGSAGFGGAIDWWAYLGTQFGAIVHYLRLCVWPHPLLLDYGTGTAQGAGQIVPYALVVGLLGVAVLVALWRWPRAGFLGAWFFAILAPTSSVVPVVTQTVAEHRMYLPLAAVLTGSVAGGFLAGQWLVRSQRLSRLASQVLGGSLVTFAAIVFGILTFHRNVDYQSPMSMWQDAAAKAPGNERVHNNFGLALAGRGRVDEAIAQYRTALELKPVFVDASINLGAALVARGRLDEAIAQYRKALEIKADSAEAYCNLGRALARLGRLDQAMAQYRKALEIKPGLPEAHNNLGNALTNRGQLAEAMAHYRKALESKPDYAEAHNNLGAALAGQGRFDEAMAHYQQAVEIAPGFAGAYYNAGMALANLGHLDGAMAHYRKALEIKPDYIEAHYSFGGALATRGRFAEAVAHYRLALDLATQHHNRAWADAARAKIAQYEAGKPVSQPRPTSVQPLPQP
jgi:tetratricopeptide (TPR) repeat protein